MRRYDDPVEVRRGRLDEAGAPEQSPVQFLWRGRLWKVRAVLAHSVETGAWWQPDAARAAPVHDLLHERELWRVQAGRGGLESDGVFELSLDCYDGSWQLVGCQD